jgi:hypothetical protein
MNWMNWILGPIGICLALAGGFGACIYLFVSIGVRQTAQERRLKADLKGVREALEELRRKAATADAEMDERIALQAAPPEESVNVAKRAQAIRMHRRGEAPEAISSALRLPQSEVDLMLKVQKIVMESL